RLSAMRSNRYSVLLGFNWTNKAIGRRIDVPHFETGPFPGQTTRAHGREAPALGDFRPRIGLVQELRKAASSEKFFEPRRNRFVVDELLGHQGLDVLQAHLLFDRPFHPY